MKTNLKSNVFFTTALITTNIFAVSVNSEQSLLSELAANSSSITIDNDIVITKPLRLSPNQSINANKHSITLNVADSDCQMYISSGNTISNATFISPLSNTNLICVYNAQNVTLSTTTIVSSGTGTNEVSLNNTNNVTFTSDQFVKSGTGNVIAANSAYMFNIQSSNFTSTSTDNTVILNNTISSTLNNNNFALSTGSQIVQVGIVANGGNSLSINNNTITTSSTNADAIRIISGSDFVISGNKFILGPAIPSLSIGIFFGNNNEAPFSISNITISNNDFSQYTIYNSGYLPALNFSATSTTSINPQSVGNIIGSNKLYGGAENGSVITGAVSFTDGGSFPQL